MEIDIAALVSDGGALGVLCVVLFMVNRHFTRMLDAHDEDRKTWLEAIKEITVKLGLIENDISDIDDDVRDITKTLEERL